ncbi:TetR/AcrR family transcriptional regulator [Shewanella maritima]|uniref:TetR/AcrR family transcriptional regulator n=1 Tax=Shewanella maritima TaxID=2520507 RepID=UPI0037357B00
MSAVDLTPKQQRSQRTHEKFLNALQQALETKYFEHISIKELAEGAEVSVGTFYRRFENKEALLPLLYDDFGQELAQFVELLENTPCEDLSQQVSVLCQQTADFLLPRKSVFRTIHLNARLHPDTMFSNPSLDRNHAYGRIAQLVVQQMPDTVALDKRQRAANMAVYMLVNGLLDQILYPTLTPATACPIAIDDFVTELNQMILSYLQSQV